MNNEEKKTILLVEDEVLIGLAEKKKLEHYGYSVHHITNGEKALQTITQNEIPVDLILMDIDLGSGIDGTQAAAQILNHKDIPVVFLSSHSEPEVVQKTENITSYGYILKNSSITVLDASIKMAFKLFEAKQKTRNEIEERIRTEEALQESERTFRKLFEESADAILLIDKTGVFVECNQAALTLLKMERDEFLSLPPSKISPEFQANGLRSDESALEMIEQAYKKGHNRFDWTCINSEGDEFIVEVSLMPIMIKGELMLHTTWRDVTKRKSMENELLKSNIMLESLLNAIPDVIGIQDQDHNVIQYNAAGYAFFGKDKEIIDGKKCYDLLGKTIPCEICAYKETFKTKKPATVEKYIAKDAAWFEERSYPVLDSDNNIIYVIKHIRNITERKQNEEEIQKQLTEKETLLHEVHHRVKNNISNIEGLLTVQADSSESPEVSAALYNALSRVQSIRILYDKLLISKNYKQISIQGYIEDIIDSIHTIFDIEKSITIEKSISEFCLSSKQAFNIGIITNELLTNIFKYAFPDNKNGKVSISINKENNRVTINIQDNGIGIDETIIESNSPQFGLTIVKMLVEQLNGSYSIVNDHGTRSTIEFDL